MTPHHKSWRKLCGSSNRAACSSSVTCSRTRQRGRSTVGMTNGRLSITTNRFSPTRKLGIFQSSAGRQGLPTSRSGDRASSSSSEPGVALRGWLTWSLRGSNTAPRPGASPAHRAQSPMGTPNSFCVTFRGSESPILRVTKHYPTRHAVSEPSVCRAVKRQPGFRPEDS